MPFLLCSVLTLGAARQFIHPLGKKGIGLGKRAPSPTELERQAKVAKAAEEANKESFRDRSRREFEQRRAENRLGPAQQTCATLDERAGKEVRWLVNDYLVFVNGTIQYPLFTFIFFFHSGHPTSHYYSAVPSSLTSFPFMKTTNK
jgi:hypothetical protein